jgi:hypothetical protein
MSQTPFEKTFGLNVPKVKEVKPTAPTTKPKAQDDGFKKLLKKNEADKKKGEATLPKSKDVRPSRKDFQDSTPQMKASNNRGSKTPAVDMLKQVNSTGAVNPSSFADTFTGRNIRFGQPITPESGWTLNRQIAEGGRSTIEAEMHSWDIKNFGVATFGDVNNVPKDKRALWQARQAHQARAQRILDGGVDPAPVRDPANYPGIDETLLSSLSAKPPMSYADTARATVKAQQEAQRYLQSDAETRSNQDLVKLFGDRSRRGSTFDPRVDAGTRRQIGSNQMDAVASPFEAENNDPISRAIGMAGVQSVSPLTGLTMSIANAGDVLQGREPRGTRDIASFLAKTTPGIEGMSDAELYGRAAASPLTRFFQEPVSFARAGTGDTRMSDELSGLGAGAEFIGNIIPQMAAGAATGGASLAGKVAAGVSLDLIPIAQMVQDMGGIENLPAMGRQLVETAFNPNAPEGARVNAIGMLTLLGFGATAGVTAKVNKIRGKVAPTSSLGDLSELIGNQPKTKWNPGRYEKVVDPRTGKVSEVFVPAESEVKAPVNAKPKVQANNRQGNPNLVRRELGIPPETSTTLTASSNINDSTLLDDWRGYMDSFELPRSQKGSGNALSDNEIKAKNKEFAERFAIELLRQEANGIKWDDVSDVFGERMSGMSQKDILGGRLQLIKRADALGVDLSGSMQAKAQRILDALGLNKPDENLPTPTFRKPRPRIDLGDADVIPTPEESFEITGKTLADPEIVKQVYAIRSADPSMGPGAIAKKLGLDIEDVQNAFDDINAQKSRNLRDEYDRLGEKASPEAMTEALNAAERDIALARVAYQSGDIELGEMNKQVADATARVDKINAQKASAKPEPAQAPKANENLPTPTFRKTRPRIDLGDADVIAPEAKPQPRAQFSDADVLPTSTRTRARRGVEQPEVAKVEPTPIASPTRAKSKPKAEPQAEWEPMIQKRYEDMVDAEIKLRKEASDTVDKKSADPRLSKFEDTLNTSPDRKNPDVYVPGKSGYEVTRSEWVGLQPEAYQERASNGHRSSVESRLRQGLPVPSKVLADYPDLVKKYINEKYRKPAQPQSFGDADVLPKPRAKKSERKVEAKQPTQPRASFTPKEATGYASGDTPNLVGMAKGKPSVEPILSKPNTQKTFTAIYNGKEVEVDDFKRAAQRVADNLSTGDHGYVRDPKGKLYEIATDKRSAIPVEKIRTKQERDIARLEEQLGKAKSDAERASIQSRIDATKSPQAPPAAPAKGVEAKVKAPDEPIVYNDMVVTSSPDGRLQKIAQVRGGTGNGDIVTWDGDNQIALPAKQVRHITAKEVDLALGSRLRDDVADGFLAKPKAAPIEEEPVRGYSPFSKLRDYQKTRAEFAKEAEESLPHGELTNKLKAAVDKASQSLGKAESAARERGRKKRLLNPQIEVDNDLTVAKYRDALKKADNAYKLKRGAEIDIAHRAAVETALEEGKPVPAEVLADYPDLVAKVKPDELPGDVAPEASPVKGKEPWEQPGGKDVLADAYMAEADRLARGQFGKPLNDSWTTVDGQPKLVKGIPDYDKPELVRRAADAIRAKLARGEEPELLERIKKAALDTSRKTLEVKLVAGGKATPEEIIAHPDLVAKYAPDQLKPTARQAKGVADVSDRLKSTTDNAFEGAVNVARERLDKLNRQKKIFLQTYKADGGDHLAKLKLDTAIGNARNDLDAEVRNYNKRNAELGLPPIKAPAAGKTVVTPRQAKGTKLKETFQKFSDEDVIIGINQKKNRASIARINPEKVKLLRQLAKDAAEYGIATLDEFVDYVGGMVDSASDQTKKIFRVAAKQVWEAEKGKAAPVAEATSPKGATGLANRVNDAEAATGSLSASPKGRGVKKGTGQAEGKRQVQAGEVNPSVVANDIAQKQRAFANEVEVGVLMEGKRQLVNARDSARAAWDKAIDSKGDTTFAKQEFDKAQAELDDFVGKVQTAKTKTSDAFRALQEGTRLEDGSFDDILDHYARKNNKKRSDLDLNSKDLVELKKVVEARDSTIKKLEEMIAKKETAKVESGFAAARGQARSRGPRTREAIRTDMDAAKARLKESVKKSLIADSSVAGSGFGALGGNFQALAKNAPEVVKAIKDIVVLTIEDLNVQRLDKTFYDAVRKESEMDLSDSDIRSVMAGFYNEKVVPISEIRQRVAKLKSLARAEETLKRTLSGENIPVRKRAALTAEFEEVQKEIASIRKTTNLQGSIKDLEGQLASGKFTVNPPREVRELTIEQAKLQKRVDDLRKRIKMMVKLNEPKTSADKLADFVGASVLSNPVARAFDLAANTVKLGSYLATNGLRVPMHVAMDRLFLKGVSGGGERLITIRKLRRAMEGYGASVREESSQNMKGMDPDSASKYGRGSFVARATGMTDIPFKEFYNRLALDDMASAIAEKELGRRAPKADLDYRIRELIQNPTDEMVAVAHDWALRQTFNIDNVFGKLQRNIVTSLEELGRAGGGEAGKAYGKVAGIILETPFRFSKVIGNVALDRLNSNPVAAAVESSMRLASMGKYGYSPKQARLIADIAAKGLTGMALTYAGQYAYENGAYDPELIKTEGGTMFFDFGKIAQIGGPLAPFMFGAAMRKIEDLDLTEKQKSALRFKMTVDILADQPTFSGAKRVSQALEGEKGAEKFAGQVSSTLVPFSGFLGEWARQQDSYKTKQEYQKERRVKSDSFTDEFKKKIPWLRETLPDAKFTKVGKSGKSSSQSASPTPTDFSNMTNEELMRMSGGTN